MRPFWFGCVAGAAPWVAIGYNLVAAEQVPGFVIGIFVSLFVFFSSFALNQWLQYRRIGPWRTYAYGEKVYLVLSLVASRLSLGRSSPARWRRSEDGCAPGRVGVGAATSVPHAAGDVGPHGDLDPVAGADLGQEARYGRIVSWPAALVASAEPARPPARRVRFSVGTTGPTT